MSKLQEQVIEFHQTFDMPVSEVPSVPSDAIIRFRVALLTEEFFEFLEAIFGSVPDWSLCKEIIANVIRVRDPRVDMVALADALGDLDYVNEGTRIVFGIEGDAIAEVIHAANMAKVLGEARIGGSKPLKPAQWVPPDEEIKKLLVAQIEGRVRNIESVIKFMKRRNKFEQKEGEDDVEHHD